MPKFFPQFLITGIVLLLLLGAGYGLAQAARAIPWDCTDWQAFAHEDRTIAILESLAENRGKALYCGVDQSDTFAKAETWEAGKDRNERDDTIYSGEQGIFRGFIAAQEGYLTDGESGVTGVSIDRIFEFPREKKKRRRWKKVTLRMVVALGDAPRLRSPLGPTIAPAPDQTEAYRRARAAFDNTASNAQGPPAYRGETMAAATFLTRAQTVAPTYCIDAGYERAVGISIGPNIWEYTHSINSFNAHLARATKARNWTATCEKEVRRRR